MVGYHGAAVLTPRRGNRHEKVPGCFIRGLSQRGVPLASAHRLKSSGSRHSIRIHSIQIPSLPSPQRPIPGGLSGDTARVQSLKIPNLPKCSILCVCRCVCEFSVHRRIYGSSKQRCYVPGWLLSSSFFQGEVAISSAPIRDRMRSRSFHLQPTGGQTKRLNFDLLLRLATCRDPRCRKFGQSPVWTM